VSDRPKLRVQIREQIGGPGPRVRVEVLDPDGNVLGDLANVVPYDGIRYRLDSRGTSILSVEFAVERASIDALEVAGYNLTAQHTTVDRAVTEDAGGGDG
jgi:hypothetical protein